MLKKSQRRLKPVTKMQQNTSIKLARWLIALTLTVASIQHISCGHTPPSEPYSYNYDPYSYGYDVEDNYGNKQWKQERSSHPHEVHGSYGYRDMNGVYREVTYVADKNGFRANIKTNEPGVKVTRDPANVNIDSFYSPPAPPVYGRQHT